MASFGSRARGRADAGSDHDILVLAHELPADPFERSRKVRSPLRGLREAAEVHVMARTLQEFRRDVTPLHLDMSLDAVVLLEKGGILTASLERLRELIAEAGLERQPDLSWRWRTPPGLADWAIRCDGVSV